MYEKFKIEKFNTEISDKSIQYGNDVLTDSELLSLITGKTVRTNIDNIRRMDIDELMFNGLTQRQAQKLSASLELARRLNQDSGAEKVYLHQPDQVYGYFGPMMRDLNKEVFIVAFLNSAKLLTGYHRISLGGTNATIVDPPEVLRRAVMNHAHGIILLHNHPSGNTTPSRSDINLTQRLVEGGHMMGIQVLDHIIVAGFEHISMREKGIIT